MYACRSINLAFVLLLCLSKKNWGGFFELFSYDHCLTVIDISHKHNEITFCGLIRGKFTQSNIISLGGIYPYYDLYAKIMSTQTLTITITDLYS